MAIQSIVDFVRDGLKASAEAAAPRRLESELAYAELLKPVVRALSEHPQLAEGELFKHVDGSSIRQFQMSLAEMQSRGLVHVAELRQPYNEPVYRLTSRPQSD